MLKSPQKVMRANFTQGFSSDEAAGVRRRAECSPHMEGGSRGLQLAGGCPRGTKRLNELASPRADMRHRLAAMVPGPSQPQCDTARGRTWGSPQPALQIAHRPDAMPHQAPSHYMRIDCDGAQHTSDGEALCVWRGDGTAPQARAHGQQRARSFWGGVISFLRQRAAPKRPANHRARRSTGHNVCVCWRVLRGAPQVWPVPKKIPPPPGCPAEGSHHPQWPQPRPLGQPGEEPQGGQSPVSCPH